MSRRDHLTRAQALVRAYQRQAPGVRAAQDADWAARQLGELAAGKPDPLAGLSPALREHTQKGR